MTLTPEQREAIYAQLMSCMCEKHATSQRTLDAALAAIERIVASPVPAVRPRCVCGHSMSDHTDGYGDGDGCWECRCPDFTPTGDKP
jgi:hypothetical protein